MEKRGNCCQYELIDIKFWDNVTNSRKNVLVDQRKSAFVIATEMQAHV